MSAVLRAIKSSPLAYHKMDDTSPFQDYSGYNRNATATGTSTSTGLGNGFAYSTVTASGSQITYASPVFVKNAEKSSFSLEATVRVLGGTAGEQQVLSHLNTMDGLTINGTKVAFTTTYTSTGSARCEYDIQVPRRVHLVGVHTPERNILYVDGVAVSEVEITEDQLADTYVTSNGSLYSGGTSATQQLAINGVGIYGAALTPEAVFSHWEEGALSVNDPSSSYGGQVVPFYEETNNLIFSSSWSTESDWNSSDTTTVSTDLGYLTPIVIEDVPQAGTWMTSVSLDVTSTTALYGVNMWWDGVGAIVEASLDATTWTAVQRGVNISLIPQGFDPTDEMLFVRVRFDGTSASHYFAGLTVRVYDNVPISIFSNRTVVGSGASIGFDNPAVELSDDWGLNISGGSVTITADTSDAPKSARTIEVWVKRKGTFSINKTPTTTYRNGVAGSLTTGDWQLVHYVLGANDNTDITFTGDAVIGRVVLYSTALTATQVSNIYNSYLGIRSTQINDISTIAVTEPANAAYIYAHDWSISTAG